MFFANYNALATSPLRKKVLEWAHEGIRTALPEHFMQESIRFKNGVLYVKERYISILGRRIFVVGAGKAGAAMAVELDKIIGTENIHAGVVSSNDTTRVPQKIIVHPADHPVPSERSMAGAQKILALKEQFAMNENDLLISLISGGGSSLMACPAPGISFSDKQKTIHALIKSGGNVHEITVVKKKISSIKGGKLALHFYPTPIVSLILSDVVGNNMDVIASGPFAKDSSSFDDALRIIEKLDF